MTRLHKALLHSVLLLLFVMKNCCASVEQARDCLKELESKIEWTAHFSHWKSLRENFTNAVNQVKEEADLNVLFEQLISLENNIKYNYQSDSWAQWKRKYWKVMINPNFKIRMTVTRFIIVFLFMEQNLLQEALNENWVGDSRYNWRRYCRSLENPILRFSFYDELYLNVHYTLRAFGYRSLEEYSNEALKVVSAVNRAAEVLNKLINAEGKKEIVSGSLSISSGALTLLGLILAPFTAGISLGATGGGLALGIISSAIKLDSVVQQIQIELRAAKNVAKVTKTISGETLALLHTLQKYEESTEEIRGLNEAEIWKLIKNPALIAWKVKVIGYNSNRAFDVHQLLCEVHNMNRRRLGRPIDLVTKKAFEGAAPEIQTPKWLLKLSRNKIPRILVKAGTSFRSPSVHLNGFFSLVSIGFGIWDVIYGHEKMKKGSVSSVEFRTLAKSIDDAMREILVAYNIDPEMAYTEEFTHTVLDKDGRSEEWHRACFHGDKCVLLAVLSRNVTAFESQYICRKHGHYLLPVGSKKGSDIIRKWLTSFGRSAWVSSSSVFRDFAPGHPRYRERPCLFYSKDHSFQMVDASCNRVRKSALLCC